MPSTKKQNQEKTPSSVSIYLSAAEFDFIQSDLVRANSHRVKKLSRNEFLRSRLFNTKVREVGQESAGPSDLKNLIQQTIQDCWRNQGLVVGESVKVADLVQQLNIEQGETRDAKIDQLRKDLLDLREDLGLLKTSAPRH